MSVFTKRASAGIRGEARIRLPTRALRRRGWSASAIAAVILLFVVVAFASADVLWRLEGGGIYVVATPSMSPILPVGSLVLTRPPSPTQLGVGAIVTFHPPRTTGVTYTHRIVAVRPGPLYLTRGDREMSDDPWLLREGNVVGVMVLHWPVLGWVLTAAPWLLGASLLLAAGLLLAPRRSWRESMALVGTAALVCVPMLQLRPLARATPLPSTSLATGVRSVVVINTGVLPLRFSFPGGSGKRAAPGWPVVLNGPTAQSEIDARVDLSVWGWAGVASVCLLPFAMSLVLARDRRRTTRRQLGGSPDDRGETYTEATLADAQ